MKINPDQSSVSNFSKPIFTSEGDSIPSSVIGKLGEISGSILEFGVKGSIKLLSPAFSNEDTIDIYHQLFNEHPECYSVVQLCDNLCLDTEDRLLIYALLFHMLGEVKDSGCSDLVGSLFLKHLEEAGKSSDVMKTNEQARKDEQFVESIKPMVKEFTEGFFDILISESLLDKKTQKITSVLLPEILSYGYRAISSYQMKYQKIQPIFSLPFSKQISCVSSVAVRNVWGIVSAYLPSIDHTESLPHSKTVLKAVSVLSKNQGRIAKIFGYFFPKSDPVKPIGNETQSAFILLLLINQILAEQPSSEKWNSVQKKTLEIFNRSIGIDPEDVVAGGGDRFTQIVSRYSHYSMRMLRSFIATDEGRIHLSRLINRIQPDANEAMTSKVMDNIQRCIVENDPAFEGIWNLISTTYEQISQKLSQQIIASHAKLFQNNDPKSFSKMIAHVMQSTITPKGVERNSNKLSEKLLNNLFPSGKNDLPFSENIQGSLWKSLKDDIVPCIIDVVVAKIEDPRFRINFALQQLKLNNGSINIEKLNDMDSLHQELENEIAVAYKREINGKIQDFWEGVSDKIDKSIENCLGEKSKDIKDWIRYIGHIIALDVIAKMLMKPVTTGYHYCLDYQAQKLGRKGVQFIASESMNQLGYEIVNSGIEMLYMKLSESNNDTLKEILGKWSKGNILNLITF